VGSGRNLCARITYARKVLILWWVGVAARTWTPPIKCHSRVVLCSHHLCLRRLCGCCLCGCCLCGTLSYRRAQHLSPLVTRSTFRANQAREIPAAVVTYVPFAASLISSGPHRFASRALSEGSRSNSAPGWVVRLSGEEIPIAAVPRSYVITLILDPAPVPSQAHLITTFRARFGLTPGDTDVKQPRRQRTPKLTTISTRYNSVRTTIQQLNFAAKIRVTWSTCAQSLALD
jgi:hypothetical protein